MSRSARSGRALLEREARTNPAVVELATLAALAVRAEPELLRALRLRLMPRSDAGVEADLWFSDLLQSRGPDGIVLLPEVVEELRKTLKKRLKKNHLERERVHRAWAITERLHRKRLSPALWLEEQVAWYALSGEGDPEAALNSALVALVEEQRTGIAHWAARALPRLPPEARNTRAAWLLGLAAGRHLQRSIGLDTGKTPDDLMDMDLRNAFEKGSEVDLLLRRNGDSLQIGEKIREARYSLRVPDTNPRLVELRWRAGDQERRMVVAIAPGRSKKIKVGSGAVRLRSADGAVYELRGRVYTSAL